MSDQDQIQAVARIYEAFGRADVPFILNALASDVEWEFDAKQNYSIPWYVPGRGIKTVTNFFENLARELEITKFNILGIGKVGDFVVDAVEIEATVRKTGKTLKDFEVHIWKFNNAGKVSHFKHVIDTIHHQAVSRE